MTTTTALKTYEPYQDIRAELAELAVTNDNAVFDYEDPKGAKLAKSHVHSLRVIKGLIERKRKLLKADSLEAGRRVDSVAKELTAQVVAMIDVHEAPLKAANVKHREKVISEAAAAIDDLFQTEHHGDDIVSAIVAGGIPHVSVQF